MENQEKLVQCYTDVLNSLFAYTGMLAEEIDPLDIEDILAFVEKHTVILKRLGETQIIETVENDLDGHNEEEGETE